MGDFRATLWKDWRFSSHFKDGYWDFRAFLRKDGEILGPLYGRMGDFRATLRKDVGFSSHFKEGWGDSRATFWKDGGFSSHFKEEWGIFGPF